MLVLHERAGASRRWLAPAPRPIEIGVDALSDIEKPHGRYYRSSDRRAEEVVMHPREFWALLKEAGSQWWLDNAPHLGAALAFYATFSLAPLLIITVAMAGLVFGHDAAEGRLRAQLGNFVGDEMGVAIQTTIASARDPAAGMTATLVGGGMLLLGAAWLFGELHEALNTVWKVKPKRPGGWQFVKYHALSLAMVFGTTTLLLVSLIASAAFTALQGQLGDWQPFHLGEKINFCVSLAAITVIIAMLNRYLTDAVIAWKDIWVGSIVTSLLFSLGKLLIGMYLSHTAVTSPFGAAGSLAAILIWLYYSAQIFLFGAELTKAYAGRRRLGLPQK